MNYNFYFPYLLNYNNPVVEDFIIYGVAYLVAILVSAEGQGFIATLLGDSDTKNKNRMHFNVFLHLSFLGTINFLIAGFGWAKEITIDSAKFGGNRKLFLVLARLAGPISNLLMANIAASLSWILGKYGFYDKVFSTIVVVNVTMAVYSLLPIPPLPGSVVWQILPKGVDTAIRGKINSCLLKITPYCPYIIIVIFFMIRINGLDILSTYITPVVSAITYFVLDI